MSNEEGKEYSIKLMLNNAHSFYQGSVVLKSHDKFSIDTGDSWYLLRLLSLELFIKALHYYHKDMYKRFGHEYDKVYGSLPAKVQLEVLNRFNVLRKMLCLQESETTGEIFMQNLKHFGDAFVSMRYYYDNYRDMSQEAIRERVGSMLKPNAKYDIEYRIEILDNTIESLKQQCSLDIRC